MTPPFLCRLGIHAWKLMVESAFVYPRVDLYRCPRCEKYEKRIIG